MNSFEQFDDIIDFSKIKRFLFFHPPHLIPLTPSYTLPHPTRLTITEESIVLSPRERCGITGDVMISLLVTFVESGVIIKGEARRISQATIHAGSACRQTDHLRATVHQ